jgi:hypothetical protein
MIIAAGIVVSSPAISMPALAIASRDHTFEIWVQRFIKAEDDQAKRDEIYRRAREVHQRKSFRLSRSSPTGTPSAR